MNIMHQIRLMFSVEFPRQNVCFHLPKLILNKHCLKKLAKVSVPVKVSPTCRRKLFKKLNFSAIKIKYFLKHLKNFLLKHILKLLILCRVKTRTGMDMKQMWNKCRFKCLYRKKKFSWHLCSRDFLTRYSKSLSDLRYLMLVRCFQEILRVFMLVTLKTGGLLFLRRL